MNWNNIFNPDLFIQNMLTIGEVEQEEIENNEPYGMMVTNLCNNACTWMCLTCVKNHPNLLPNLYFVTGNYKKSFEREHSWVEYRINKSILVLDLTLSQFRCTQDKLYVGPKTKEFNEYASICFTESDKLKEFIIGLGI